MKLPYPEAVSILLDIHEASTEDNPIYADPILYQRTGWTVEEINAECDRSLREKFQSLSENEKNQMMRMLDEYP